MFNLLLQVAPQQLVELVRSDGLHGRVEEAHGLLVGTVEHSGASVHTGFVAVGASVIMNLSS